MDGGNSSDSDMVKSVRNMTISRRGGVKTRGGRLPPICLREITQVTSTKKVVAPKIPQRRKTIKQEAETPIKSVYRCDSRADYQDSRGRGRGRQPKAFIQMGGSFLAAGPAAKTKKEIDHERFSFSRASRSSAADTCERKVDSETLKCILDSYDDNEIDEDFFNEMPPYRLPLLKRKEATSKVPRIKTEPLDDLEDAIKKEEKVDIKKEPVDIKEEEPVDIKKEEKVDIKKENINATDDDEPSQSLKKFSIKTEDEPKFEVKRNPAEAFQNVEGDGKMLLLQFPMITLTKEAKTTEKSSKDPNKEENNESEQESSILDKLDEGPVGKLRFMKSGKMRLVIGSDVFELVEGSPSESYMEVASIRLTQGGGGHLNVLGKIDRQLLVVPQLEKLIPEDKVTCEKNCL